MMELSRRTIWFAALIGFGAAALTTEAAEHLVTINFQQFGTKKLAKDYSPIVKMGD